MSDQSKAQNSFRMALPIIPSNLIETWQMPMKVFLEEQTELLEESRKITAAWMKRRQEAMETGMQAFGAMAGCKDPGSMAAICGEWFTASMNRLMADMNDARDEGVRLAEIGRKSMACLFQQGADAAATDKPGPSASSRESGRAKGAARSEAVADVRERSAAE